MGDIIFINKPLVYRTIWNGGHNRTQPARVRLKENVLIKKRIFPLINKKQGLDVPRIKIVEDYLKIWWFLVALKEKRLNEIASLFSPALFSIRAWTFLIKVLITRKRSYKNRKINKIDLTNK